MAMNVSDSSSENVGGRMGRLSDLALYATLLAVSIALALFISLTLVIADGTGIGDALSALARGSFGSTSAIVNTLNNTAPVLLVAVGTAVAGRAGIVNIGQEGQLAAGAIVGTASGVFVHAPGWAHLVLILLSSAVGGSLWAGIAAVLKYTRGVNETISTLLLNFGAFAVLAFVVSRPWLLQKKFSGQQALSANPVSETVPRSAQLPLLASGGGYALNGGILLAVAVALFAAYALAHTTWGFGIRTFGGNPRAAQRAGLSPGRTGGGALVLSGGMAGLAGGVMLTGLVPILQPSFANNFGWDGLLASLVAGFNLPATIPVSLGFGALRSGGGYLEATGVSATLVNVIQAMTVFAVVLPSGYMLWRRGRRTVRPSLATRLSWRRTRTAESDG